MLRTFRYRVKTSPSQLEKVGRAVNVVWNFCNETQVTAVRRRAPWPTFYALDKLTTGSSKFIGLHAQSIQEVCAQYAQARVQHKRQKLRWRGRRSLGWIPFTNQSVKVENGAVKFMGRVYRLWYHRPLPSMSSIKCGSFSADSRGRWYVNLVVEIPDAPVVHTSMSEVGVDLGLKTFATCSDGCKIEHERLYRAAESALATAQRARKKRRISAINAKAKNSRKDFVHKASLALVKQHKSIFVGNVNAAALAKTKMAKSVLDAGWSTFRTYMRYKAITHGCRYLEVDERFTTQDCSTCLARGGPQGQKGLGIREWTCASCGAAHDRDINSAKNILRLGRQALAEGERP